MDIPAPLFRDPLYDGAADPTVIWNREEGCWWLLYTQRRATAPNRGVSFMHGSDIGIASSADGRDWLYRGTLPGLAFEAGQNTFWAPEVLWHEGRYHAYVSYVRGVPAHWGYGRSIVHYSGPSLWELSFQSELALSSGRVIDACVHRMPEGHWKMWYKDELNQSFSWAATSNDLARWEVEGPEITDCAHEGPNVFRLGGFYWMITDPWEGLGVYRSEDATHWSRQPNILARPGLRPGDGTFGNHADVVVSGDAACIFYFTHPAISPAMRLARPDFPFDDQAHRQSVLQAARLTVENGRLLCDRDHPLITLAPPEC